MRLLDLDEWARAHHGVVTLESSGMSRSAWYRAIRAGTIAQIHPHVGRLPGTPLTPEHQIIAACLAVGDTAVASHRSAARLWGIARPDDDPVDVIDRREGSRARLDGVVIHRPVDRLRLTPQLRVGIRCTNILRTLLDLGAVDPRAVRDAVGVAVAARLADLAAIERTVVDHARSGRAGVVALRAAVDSWVVDGKPADSLLEGAMAALVRRYNLPAVEFHPRILGHEVDFRIVGAPIVVECDGWLYHGFQRANFERDRVRDAELLAAGWLTLRFTYRAITTTPSVVARRIRSAVERWSPHAARRPAS